MASYSHEFYIDGALAIFGVSRPTVAGALFGLADPLSEADAQSAVTAYVGRPVTGTPGVPGGGSVDDRVSMLMRGTFADGDIPVRSGNAFVAGLASYKASVQAASVTNHTLGAAGSRTVDGYSCVAGDRVLLRAQTAGAENGIYVVGSDFALTRSGDANTAAELVGAVVLVERGSTNADKEFQQTADAITLGTTPLVWAGLPAGTLPRIVAGGNLGATPNLVLTASDLQVLLVGTLTANATLTLTGLVAGQSVRMLLTQDATGGRTLAVTVGASTAAVTINSAANSVTVVDCIYDGTDLYVKGA